MRAVYATDLSAASEAAIENETCLECLERIGVGTVDLVTVVPSNVHSGMPGMNLEERRRRGRPDRLSSGLAANARVRCRPVHPIGSTTTAT